MPRHQDSEVAGDQIMTTISKAALMPLFACAAVAMLCACADVTARTKPPEMGDGGAPSRTVSESVRESGARPPVVSRDIDVRPGTYGAPGAFQPAPGTARGPGVSGPLAPGATTMPVPRGTTMPLPGGTTMPTPGDPNSPNPPTTTTPSPGSTR
jgi:hypothetical protein